MASTQTDTKLQGNGYDSATYDHALDVSNGTDGIYSNGTKESTAQGDNWYDYGGNPLALLHTTKSARFPAFGGEMQPGLYKVTTERKFANPAPLGLSAFALTTFVLSLINIQTNGVTQPNVVLALAFAYGGFVQLLAGMWYVALLPPPPPLFSSVVTLKLIYTQQGNGHW